MIELEGGDPDIRRARVDDVGAVARLAQSVAIAGADGRDHPKGFLIPYSEQEYEDYARRADFFEVLRLQGTLRGFVLAHSAAMSAAFGGEVYEHIGATHPGAHLVVRQICVDPACAGSGFGRALYEAVFERARRAQPPLGSALCFIWEQPANEASAHFHAATGWRRVEGYSLREGSGRVGIWQRDLALR